LDYIIELILAGLPLILISVFAYWMLKLQGDLKSGRRVRLKWKDLSLPKKLYGVALVGYFAFVLYSDISSVIPSMINSELPFSAVLQNAIVAIWLGTMGLLGLGLLSSLRSPVCKPALQ